MHLDAVMVRRVGRRRQQTLPVSILGQNLLRFRTRARLSQEELAAKSGVSRTTIWRLEAGHGKRPGAATVEALAGALGVQPAELWTQISASIPIIEPAIQSFIRSPWALILRPPLTEQDLSDLREQMSYSIWINVYPSDEAVYYLTLAHRALRQGKQSSDAR